MTSDGLDLKFDAGTIETDTTSPQSDTPDALLEAAQSYAQSLSLPIEYGDISWEISKQAKRRSGYCEYEKETGNICIRLSWDAYQEYGWEKFTSVIRHELIHAWEFQEYGVSSHGERFKAAADALDVSVHCDQFTEPRLQLECLNPACSWTGDRYQAATTVTHPERYGCGKCGDRYRVIHRDSEESWSTNTGYTRVRERLGDDW